jgi:hypothetical protein
MIDTIIQFVFYIGLGIYLLTGNRWAAIGAGVCAIVIALLMILH